MEAAVAIPGKVSAPRVGSVLVLRVFDGQLRALRDHAYFNAAVATVSWLVVLIASSPRRRGKHPSLEEAIRMGEGENVEFKVSLKLDEGPGVEDYLRTIAAFLNSRGGSLFVGVQDNGKICGVTPDLERAGGRDQFKRRISNKVGSTLGTHVMSIVRVTFIEAGGLVVCRVDVDPAPEPVFFVGKETAAVLLIIRAASTNRTLQSGELSAYLRKRWR
jgi:predicted HTH transcriptional regulator